MPTCMVPPYSRYLFSYKLVIIINSLGKGYSRTDKCCKRVTKLLLSTLLHRNPSSIIIPFNLATGKGTYVVIQGSNPPEAFQTKKDRM